MVADSMPRRISVDLAIDTSSAVSALRRAALAMAERSSIARYRQRISRERTIGLAHVSATARRIRIELGLEKTHLLRIVHDPESHELEDCHDGCKAEVVCPGVTDSCRVWWECDPCAVQRDAMSAASRDEYDVRLDESGEAHGVDHQWIDGMWMTPGTTCIAYAMDTDADEFVDELAAGDYPVDLDCDEGFVRLLRIHQIKTSTGGDTHG